MPQGELKGWRGLERQEFFHFAVWKLDGKGTGGRLLQECRAEVRA